MPARAVESATTYHHGDLPAALLSATAEAIEDTGLRALSLREVARRAGVSHAAPAHHFGNREGLLTAFAVQGFERFTAALRAAPGDGPVELMRARARAYVRFAIDHRAHFEVMWRPELCDTDDPALVELRIVAYLELWESVEAVQELGVHQGRETADLVLACWSAVHGLAWLLLQEAMPPGQSERSIEDLTDIVSGIVVLPLESSNPSA